MNNTERAKETAVRIKREIDFYNGELPIDVNLAWQGYLFALTEWDLIDVNSHAKLSLMLPYIKNNPVYAIGTGDPGSHMKLDNKA